MLAIVGGCRNARLRKTRRGQRDRPEDRTGDESDERYRHTVGKAHGWLPRGPSALDRVYMPCAAANRGRAKRAVGHALHGPMLATVRKGVLLLNSWPIHEPSSTPITRATVQSSHHHGCCRIWA